VVRLKAHLSGEPLEGGLLYTGVAIGLEAAAVAVLVVVVVVLKAVNAVKAVEVVKVAVYSEPRATISRLTSSAAGYGSMEEEVSSEMA
jgi:hypothetical protein